MIARSVDSCTMMGMDGLVEVKWILRLMQTDRKSVV